MAASLPALACGVAGWLVLTRVVQLLASLTCAILNGYVIGYVYARRVGLQGSVVALELLITILLVASTVSVLLIHTGGRSKQTPWLVSGIVMDVGFAIVNLVIITMLANAGMPLGCKGLTKSSITTSKKDTSSPSPSGGPVGLSSGQTAILCSLERGIYSVSGLMVLSYTLTIVLATLQICKGRYINNGRLNDILTGLYVRGRTHRADKLNELPLRTRLLQPPPPPPSEGIQSRRSLSIRPASRASLDERVSLQVVPESSHTADGTHASSSSSSSAASRQAGNQQRRANSRHTPAEPSSSSSRSRTRLCRPQGTLLPDPGTFGFESAEEQEAASAMVVDGPRFNPTMRLSPPPPLGLSEAEADAAAAMVMDGPRFDAGEGGAQSSTPPPYSPPGRLPGAMMLGHGAEESNEMRLSEYVKGATRAQDMKDSGGL